MNVQHAKVGPVYVQGAISTRGGIIATNSPPQIAAVCYMGKKVNF